MKNLVLFTLLVALAVTAKVSFDGKQHDESSPLSIRHFLNIIRQGLGEITLDEAIHSASELLKYAEGSIVSPQDKIIVYLLEEIPKELGSVSILDYNNTDLTALARASEFVTDTANMSSTTPLTIVSLVGKTQQEIQQMMRQSDAQLDGKKVSKIMIAATPEEHSSLINSIKSPRRRLQQEGQDTSYLIKFSFSIVFIIVTAAVLISIADMKNQRDTLLYAKFVADVSNN